MDQFVASTYSSTAQLTKLLPPANEVCQKVMFLHVSVCPRGYPSMPCRWYPSMPCRSQGGCVSQHALQVSRPTPKGSLSWPEGVVQAHTRGHLQANSWGGVSQQADPPSCWLLGRQYALLECILVIILCNSASRN